MREPARIQLLPIGVPMADDSNEDKSRLGGIIIFILIFGIGNWILYETTGIFLIPIPRR